MRMITQNRPQGIDLERFTGADVELRDLAQALGSTNRYGGHGLRFYSVAEHSIRVAMMVEPRHRLAALLHDASEAYLGDLIAPVKRLLEDYRRIEDRIQAVILIRCGLPPRTPDEVAHADILIRHAEIAELFPSLHYLAPVAYYPPPLEYTQEEAIRSWYTLTAQLLGEQERHR